MREHEPGARVMSGLQEIEKKRALKSCGVMSRPQFWFAVTREHELPGKGNPFELQD